jgi:hypothetical protein
MLRAMRASVLGRAAEIAQATGNTAVAAGWFALAVMGGAVSSYLPFRLR